MPVSASAISRSVGYPAKPIRYRIRPSHQRLRLVSGTLSELQPSKATVRSPPNRTPGVPGWASGPATTSNSAFSGAGPSRRRRSRSAFSDGRGHRQALQPGGQLGPDPGIPQPRVHPQRQHEVHPDPGRQVPQPPLHRPGLRQDVIDQLERQVLR